MMMYRPSPLRYQQRSNGVKVKHVVYICLALAVLLWLIYQIKYSHESDERINLGRKDIGGNKSKNDKAEVEEENTGETDQDKLDIENEPEEDLANEEETALENEALETDSTGLIDEAREEHYKADDASSAVSHINEIRSDGEIRESFDVESVVEGGSPSNGTIMKGFSLTEITMKDTGLPMQDTTVGSDQRTIASEWINKSIIDVYKNHFESNLTHYTEHKIGESSDNETESSASVKTIMFEASMEARNSPESVSELENEFTAKKSDATDNLAEIQHDAIDVDDIISNSLELKDVRTDLDTLPMIQTEGTNPEDIAAD